MFQFFFVYWVIIMNVGISSLFQSSLSVTSECFLKCSFCTLWKKSVSLSDTFDVDSFLLKHHSDSYINIVGGDPLLFPSLYPLLSALKKAKKHVVFWMTGQAELEVYEALLPFVSSVCFHLPSCDRSSYLSVTGVDGFDSLCASVSFFKENSMGTCFFHRVRSETIDILPDLYAFSLEKKCRLILFCDPADLLGSDHLAYVKRFYSIKNVFVYIGTFDFQSCASLSTNSLNSFLKNFKNEFCERVFG